MNKFIIGISISITCILILLILFFYFYLKRKFKNNKIKKLGKITEDKVNYYTQLWANKNNSYYIPSSIFKYDNNKLFEVDGILITQQAIIVIEVKNISGNIEGVGNQKTWFKVLGNNRFEIKSPIYQNDKHIDHIIQMTKIKVPMISLIIFDEQSTKDINVSDIPSHVLIIKFDELISNLDGLKNFLMPKITKTEIDNIHSILLKHITKSYNDKKTLLSYAKNEEIEPQKLL